MDINDLRRDPEMLGEVLLGAEHAGPGLLSRVRARVNELGSDSGPAFVTGSVMGMTDHRHDDSTSEAKVFDLYLSLRGWRGDSNDPEEEKGRLLRYRFSDVDALLGDREEEDRTGYLAIIRMDVHQALKSPDGMKVNRLVGLMTLLVGWLDSGCAHEFGEMPSELDPSIKVLVCKKRGCGARLGTTTNRDREERWLAV